MIELTQDGRKIKLTYENTQQHLIILPVPIRKHSIIQEYQAQLLEIFCDFQFHIGSTIADSKVFGIIDNIIKLLPVEPQDEQINIDSLDIYDIQAFFFTTSKDYSDDPAREGCQLKLEEEHYLLPSLLAKIHKLDFFSEAVKASNKSMKRRQIPQK